MTKRIPFPYHLINKTYATIRYAFDKGKDTIADAGDMGSVNITDILTHVIQDVGRFAERYASDVLYTLDDVRTLCDSVYPPEQDIDEIFVMGIRRDGVDCNSFLMSRLMDTCRNSYVHTGQVYRRVLGIRVQVCRKQDRYTPRVICTLRDLTDAFSRINPADLDSSGRLIHPPYENGNPEPVDPYGNK